MLLDIAGDLGLEVGHGLESGRRILRRVMVAKKPIEGAEQSAERPAGAIHAPQTVGARPQTQKRQPFCEALQWVAAPGGSEQVSSQHSGDVSSSGVGGMGSGKQDRVSRQKNDSFVRGK